MRRTTIIPQSIPLPFPFCPKNRFFTYSPNSIQASDNNIVTNLVSIITKQRPFSPDNPELQSFAPYLTTKIVESVLNQLNSWGTAHKFFTWASNQNGYKHNCYTYNTMASILSRARQNAPMRRLAFQLVDSRCSLTSGALGFFVRRLGELGMVEEANEVFDQIKEKGLCVPDSYSYNCLLDAISKSSEIEMVERRLKEMKALGFKLDKYSLTPVLQVYCNSGRFDIALSVFNEMEERRWVDTHVFSILVLALSKFGEVDKAFELIEAMEERKHAMLNEKTFCVLIHGFVKESRVDKALLLLDKMCKAGFYPHISLYDVIVEGLYKNKEFDKALDLFFKMKKQGIQPDFGLLAKMVNCLSEEGKILELLEEVPEHIMADEKAVTFLCNSLLSFHVSNGEIGKAYQLLRAMMGDSDVNNEVLINTLLRGKKAKFADTMSFCIVINGMLKVGKLDMALSLSREMLSIGCKLTAELYNALVEGLCNSNRLEESIQLMVEMRNSGCKPNQFTYNCIYGCLCKRGDVVGAVDIIKELRLHGHQPWIKHTTSLVKKLCENGRALEACNFLSHMVEEGFLPDIVSFSAAMSGLIKFRKVDQALELFQNLCAKGCRPDVFAYSILIKGLCKVERISEAQELMHEMEVAGLVPSNVTYNSMIDGCCKAGEIDKAMLYLFRMVGKNIEPDVITYTTLVDGLCNAGRPDDAILLWKEMVTKKITPNEIAFMAIVHGLCKCGRPNEALEYFRQMKGKGMKAESFVYVSLLTAFISDQNLLMAYEILKELIDRGSLPNPLDKNYPALRDAIMKLLEDARTSSSIQEHIVQGSIPAVDPLATTTDSTYDSSS